MVSTDNFLLKEVLNFTSSGRVDYLTIVNNNRTSPKCMDSVDSTSQRETGVLLVPVPTTIRVPLFLFNKLNKRGSKKFSKLRLHGKRRLSRRYCHSDFVT